MAEKEETGEFKYVDDSNYTNSDGTELEGVLGGGAVETGNHELFHLILLKRNIVRKKQTKEKCLHYTVYNVVPC